MPANLPLSVSLSCLWRTAAVNSAMTARGMQQLGLVFALAPALRFLYQDPEARARAFARYAEHNNTHAFMLPSYVGLLLSIEQQVAAGRVPEAQMGGLRKVLATTLSALGDGFFSGAVRTFWALVTICLLLEGMIDAAAALTVFFVVLLWGFRISGFFYCLKHGIAAMQWLRRIDLISWTERVKIFNSLLIILLLLILLSKFMWEWSLHLKIAVFLFIPVASWLVGRLHIARTVLWLAALGVFFLLENGIISF